MNCVNHEKAACDKRPELAGGEYDGETRRGTMKALLLSEDKGRLHELVARFFPRLGA